MFINKKYLEEIKLSEKREDKKIFKEFIGLYERFYDEVLNDNMRTLLGDFSGTSPILHTQINQMQRVVDDLLKGENIPLVNNIKSIYYDFFDDLGINLYSYLKNNASLNEIDIFIQYEFFNSSSSNLEHKKIVLDAISHNLEKYDSYYKGTLETREELRNTKILLFDATYKMAEISYKEGKITENSLNLYKEKIEQRKTEYLKSYNEELDKYKKKLEEKKEKIRKTIDIRADGPIQIPDGLKIPFLNHEKMLRKEKVKMMESKPTKSNYEEMKEKFKKIVDTSLKLTKIKEYLVKQKNEFSKTLRETSNFIKKEYVKSKVKYLLNEMREVQDEYKNRNETVLGNLVDRFGTDKMIDGYKDYKYKEHQNDIQYLNKKLKKTLEATRGIGLGPEEASQIFYHLKEVNLTRENCQIFFNTIIDSRPDMLKALFANGEKDEEKKPKAVTYWAEKISDFTKEKESIHNILNGLNKSLKEKLKDESFSFKLALENEDYLGNCINKLETLMVEREKMAVDLDI